jgi:hypothetical protein
MACRVQNLGRHRLALSLRGGEVLYLEPHEVSRALREEALYDNMDVREWERRGLIRRVSAKMSEVLAVEGQILASEAAKAKSQQDDDAEGIAAEERDEADVEAAEPHRAASGRAAKGTPSKTATGKASRSRATED